MKQIASASSNPTSSHRLVRYDAMCRAIDEAHRVDEVKDIRDRALALEYYNRQAQNTDAELQACQIRLRAERKAGQLLTVLLKHGGDTKSKSAETTSILKANGISKDQSSQWQKLGAMPQREFDTAMDSAAGIPTTKGVLRAMAEPQQRAGSPEAVFFWGRLMDFERIGLLEQKPADLIETMLEHMKNDVHRLAPKVSQWLKQIGKMP